MLNFFLLGAFFTGVFSVAAYSVYSHNQNISSNIEKSDELKTSQKRVTLLGTYSATGNSGQSDVSKKINLSTLVEQKLSGKETEDMNNFQQAIRKVLIESNNENPSCSDLVNTGLINITDCNNIKDKLNNFARIDDRKIQVYNQDVSKISNNREYFNSKNVNEDNSTTFTTFTKDNLSASRNMISKQINKTNSFNNIIESLANDEGQVISWSSAGKMGFRGSKKNTPYAAQMAAEDCAKVAFDLGLRKVKAYVKGPGNGRESAIRAVHGAGIEVIEIIDATPLPHNGCRPPKRRRV